MDDILRSMAASRADIEKECLNAHDYQRLADMVDRNATAIVKNCKLSKDADKAFHTIVLNDLTGGAQLMRSSPRLQAKRVGALGVLQSLRNYGEYFQHPDWSMGATSNSGGDRLPHGDMTSLSLLLWIVSGVALQLAIYLGVDIWRRWNEYQNLPSRAGAPVSANREDAAKAQRC
jgi:hypothetical protein